MVEMTEEEIITMLSGIHKDHSTDPETLCSAMLEDWGLGHADAGQYPALVGKLFKICFERGDEWTKA